MHHLVTSAVGAGYGESEMGWILEDNLPMLGALRHLNARRTKTYRVFDRAAG